MKLLLDTHIWLWSILEPARLSRYIAQELENPDNKLWLSPVSVWELLILVEKGRVVLEADPEAWIRDVLAKVPIQEAPLNHEVALKSRSLTLPHQDPADRFIAATALVYELTLVTADERLLRLEEFRVLPNA